MKARYTFYLLLFSFTLQAQTARDYAVELRTVVSENPASIILSWNADANGNGYRVYRKDKNTIEWGTALATLPNTATSYTDNNVSVGKAYEYYVRRTYSDVTRLAHGYIYAGIKAPETVSKGKMLLLVDQNYIQPLSAEIAQLQMDLVVDGWALQSIPVYRSMSVSSVKALIRMFATNDTTVKAVFLLGHIPVPYSGGFVAESGKVYPPDGHSDHGGAWAADLYYGTLDENIWTDNSVNDITPVRIENRNVVGDGKFDNMYLANDKFPDPVDLQVGRVDLVNMATINSNDTLLMKNYLDRAHAYKNAELNIVQRGLIDDNFGAMSGEAFASAAWRDFSTMYADSVFARDYFTSLKSENYQFVYGCGAGSYTSCSGVGNTANYNDTIDAIFSMTFGSYFGDWDSPDNFLRAALCSPKPALASMWNGRPHWHLHHMSLGENIGYSARLTQNNYSDFSGTNAFGYVYNSSPTFIHIALMGDPSLRLHPLEKVNSVSATSSNDSMQINISWTKNMNADGYVIARSTNIFGHYKPVGRITNNDTTWTDEYPDNGTNYYIVRAMKLEQTPSGSYYNLALGVIDSAYSKNWNTGVGEKINKKINATIFPNPSNGNFTVWLDDWKNQYAEISVYDMQGKLVSAKTISANNSSLSISKGLYLVRIKTQEGESAVKVLVN